RLDAAGHPVLAVRSGEEVIEFGISRGNVLNSDAPPSIVQDLLVARMREQLRSGHAPKTSGLEGRRVWKLLTAAFDNATATPRRPQNPAAAPFACRRTN